MVYEINFEDGVFIIRLAGRITGMDLLKAIKALAAHPEFRQGRPRIWDARGITELLLDLEHVYDIRTASIEHVQAMGTTARASVVAVREIDRATAQLFRAYLKGRPVELFDSMQAAKAWVLET